MLSPVYLSTPAPLYQIPSYHHHSIRATSLDDTLSWLSALEEIVPRQPQLSSIPRLLSLVALPRPAPRRPLAAPLHHVLLPMHALPAYPCPAALHATPTRPPNHVLSLCVLARYLSRLLLAPFLRFLTSHIKLSDVRSRIVIIF